MLLTVHFFFTQYRKRFKRALFRLELKLMHLLLLRMGLVCHSDAWLQDSRRLDAGPWTLHMFSLCLCEFSPGFPASSHSPKSMQPKCKLWIGRKWLSGWECLFVFWCVSAITLPWPKDSCNRFQQPLPPVHNSKCWRSGDRKWMDELAQTIAAHKVHLKIKGPSCTNSEGEFSMVHSVVSVSRKSWQHCNEQPCFKNTDLWAFLNMYTCS